MGSGSGRWTLRTSRACRPSFTATTTTHTAVPWLAGRPSESWRHWASACGRRRTPSRKRRNGRRPPEPTSASPRKHTTCSICHAGPARVPRSGGRTRAPRPRAEGPADRARPDRAAARVRWLASPSRSSAAAPGSRHGAPPVRRWRRRPASRSPRHPGEGGNVHPPHHARRPEGGGPRARARANHRRGGRRQPRTQAARARRAAHGDRRRPVAWRAQRGGPASPRMGRHAGPGRGVAVTVFLRPDDGRNMATE
jgi:hypothetical protein